MYRTARLSPRTREFLVEEAQRIGVARAARQSGTSRRTAYRWRRRESYLDRSSRPHRSPRRTPDALEATILGLRLELRWGPDLLGPYLELQPSTVHRVLRRHNAHRLSHLFPKPRRSYGRFPDLAPGELIALDTKVIGSIERGGGRRSPGGGRGRPHVGWRHLHVAIDLASRLVYAELRASCGKRDTIAFLAQALAFFDARGIRVRRVLTDNGSGYKRSFSEAAAGHGLRHTRTKPYHPWTNGRVERFIGTITRECLYARELHSDEERALVIALYLAYYNAERPHTRLGGRSPLEWLGQRRGVTDV
ncbi:MAG TPA: IS481 family transposase [Candidatus Limnocylindria bacterium]|nr:IS481 family transposase [Candidatus Limnocylindria bacterium]